MPVKKRRVGYDFVFRINLPTGTRLGRLASTRESPPRLVLAADTEEERAKWLAALAAADANVDGFPGVAAGTPAIVGQDPRSHFDQRAHGGRQSPRQGANTYGDGPAGLDAPEALAAS